MTANHESVHAARRAARWLLQAVIACAALSPAASPAAFIPNPGPGPGPGPGALFQLYTIPGAFDDHSGEGTMFFCTSLETAKTIHIQVELRTALNVLRNPGANNGAVDVAPGQTVTIGTHDSPAFAENAVLTLSGGNASDGSARIWSNSAKVMCAAVLIRDSFPLPAAPGINGPAPQAMVELKMIKGKFQTGD